MQKESETEMQETYYCSLCNSHFSQLKKEHQRPRPKIAPNRFYYWFDWISQGKIPRQTHYQYVAEVRLGRFPKSRYFYLSLTLSFTLASLRSICGWLLLYQRLEGVFRSFNKKAQKTPYFDLQYIATWMFLAVFLCSLFSQSKKIIGLTYGVGRLSPYSQPLLPHSSGPEARVRRRISLNKENSHSIDPFRGIIGRVYWKNK